MQKTDSEKPLVTFALFAYNQERFIKEAVEGALAQTYSPLEIILSDDCSTDKTFEIIQEMAAKYEGPHCIVLNHNSQNIGIGGHVNRVMEIAAGDLIVVAAGDDISLAERTTRIVDVWLNKNRADISIYSSFEVIDEVGDTVREYSFQKEHQSNDSLLRISSEQLVVGPSHCWSGKLFDEFGPIEYGAINEDSIIQFRASLLDGVVVVPDILVKYRIHQSNISKIETSFMRMSFLRKRAYISMVHHKRALACLKNYEKDLKLSRAMEGKAHTKEMEKVKLMISIWSLRVQFAENGLIGRLKCIYVVIKEGYGWQEFFRMFLRLPMPR